MRGRCWQSGLGLKETPAAEASEDVSWALRGRKAAKGICCGLGFLALGVGKAERAEGIVESPDGPLRLVCERTRRHTAETTSSRGRSGLWLRVLPGRTGVKGQD